MTTKKKSSRTGGRSTAKRRAQAGHPTAPSAPGVPVCSTCGQPLTRLPSYLASAMAAGAGFQCERCFFPGTGRNPVQSGVVSAETTRWWTDLAEQPPTRELFFDEPEEL